MPNILILNFFILADVHNAYMLPLVALVFVAMAILLPVCLVHWVRRSKDKALVVKATDQVLIVPPEV